MTGFNRKTTSQLCVIGNPNRCFGIHLVLGNQAEIEAAMAAVAKQGSAKKG